MCKITYLVKFGGIIGWYCGILKASENKIPSSSLIVGVGVTSSILGRLGLEGFFDYPWTLTYLVVDQFQLGRSRKGFYAKFFRFSFSIIHRLLSWVWYYFPYCPFLYCIAPLCSFMQLFGVSVDYSVNYINYALIVINLKLI